MPAGRPRNTVKRMLDKGLLPENWEEVLISMSAEGCSDIEIRAELCMLGGKFSHETWYALQDREEEFAEAIKKAKVLCQAWWEREGRKSLRDSQFNSTLWYMNMKNRFGWRDKQPDEGEEASRSVVNVIVSGKQVPEKSSSRTRVVV